jgi:Transglycosylase SLT domain
MRAALKAIRGNWRDLAFCAVLATAVPLAAARADGLEPTVDSAGACASAISAAELRYHLPHGLLFAIGEVESGRPDPATHRLEPWPWTVQSQGQSFYFDTKPQAVKWVEQAQAKGIASIDTGCMQVNLFYHPHAFQTVDDAFDPAQNADYAARFLISLHASVGDWKQAAGFYHSQTLALANPYSDRVERALTGKGWVGLPLGPPPPTVLALLHDAWGATLDTSETASAAGVSASAWTILQQPKPQPVARPWRRHRRAIMLTEAR